MLNSLAIPSEVDRTWGNQPSQADTCSGNSIPGVEAGNAVIVENDGAARKCLETALAALNHKSVTCSTVAEARNILAHTPDSLLFINLDQAEAVLEFCRWLR